MRQETAGSAEGTVAYTLAAIKDWTSLLGPGLGRRLGDGLMLGYLMYRSELVPRKAAWLGLVGGPLIILSGTLVIFGVAPADPPLSRPCPAEPLATYWANCKLASSRAPGMTLP